MMHNTNSETQFPLRDTDYLPHCTYSPQKNMRRLTPLFTASNTAMVRGTRTIPNSNHRLSKWSCLIQTEKRNVPSGRHCWEYERTMYFKPRNAMSAPGDIAGNTKRNVLCERRCWETSYKPLKINQSLTIIRPILGFLRRKSIDNQ